MKVWQKFLLLTGLFAVFETVYQICLYLERTYFPYNPICIVVLEIIVGLLLITIIILNRGFDGKPVTTDTLDYTLSYEERVKLAERINKNKKTAKILMLVFIPLAFVLCLDMLDTYLDIFTKIREIFS